MKIFVIIVISYVSLNASEILYDSTNFISKCVILKKFEDPLVSNRSLNIDDVHFYNKNKGIVFTDENYHNRVYEASDGGKTWKQISIAMDSSYWLSSERKIKPPSFKTFAYYDNYILIGSHPATNIFGKPPPTDSGFFWKSTDYGETWDTLHSRFKYGVPLDLSVNSSGDFYFIFYNDDSSGIQKSTDFGVSWNSFINYNFEQLDTNIRIQKILTVDKDFFSFLEKNDFNKYFIKYSTNNGKVWNSFQLDLGFDYYNMRVELLSKRFGIASVESSKYIGEGLFAYKLIYYKINLEKELISEFARFEKEDIEAHPLSAGTIGIRNEDVFFFNNNNGKYISFNNGDNYYPIGNKLIKNIIYYQFISDTSFITYSTGDNYVQKFSYEFPTTSVNEKNTGQNFILFPNPAQDHIEISTGGDVVSGDITIFNSLGEVVTQTSATVQNKTNKIDISHLSPGIYFVRFGDKVEKFVKY